MLETKIQDIGQDATGLVLGIAREALKEKDEDMYRRFIHHKCVIEDLYKIIKTQVALIEGELSEVSMELGGPDIDLAGDDSDG